MVEHPTPSRADMVCNNLCCLQVTDNSIRNTESRELRRVKIRNPDKTTDEQQSSGLLDVFKSSFDI